MRTGAEVLGVVETHHLARAAGAGHAREEAGGSTFAALLLLVWENLVVHLLGVADALGRQEHTWLSPSTTEGLMSQHEEKAPETKDFGGKQKKNK